MIQMDKIQEQKYLKDKWKNNKMLKTCLLLVFIFMVAVLYKVASPDFENLMPQLMADPSKVDAGEATQRLHAETKKTSQPGLKREKPDMNEVSEVNPILPVRMTEQVKVQQLVKTLDDLTFDDSQIFEVPKKLWIGDSVGSSYLMSLIPANNKGFAEQSGFEAKVVNRQNFQKYLSQYSIERVKKFITLVEKNPQGKGQDQLQDIIKTFILLNILDEHGGVMTDGKCILVEKFDWLRDIIQNPYVNRGNRGVKPQVVGFYSIDHTLGKRKEHLKPFKGMHEVDKYMNIFPSMEEYFIAAQKGASFINEMIRIIEKLILEPSIFNQINFSVRNLKAENIYDQYFYLATQVVLQKRQMHIDDTNKKPYRQFAIDYYGINLINCNYGPMMQQYFFSRNIDRLLEMFATYTVEEYAAHFGPIRYIIRMSPFDQMNRFLEQVRDRKRQSIWDRSIYQTFLYPKREVPFIKQNKEKPFVNATNEQWLSLPKIIWLFYDSGVEKAPIAYQICVENLRRIGKKSGWEVKEVSLSNGHEYLDEETLKKIQYTMDNFKLIKYSTTLSDLYRLALISKHGGVYLDATFILFEDLNWIINIGRQPSQYIYNRFGNLPKCLLYWGVQRGAPINWQINEKHNTKDIWHLAYESSFIAAEKGNQLVTQWFELLMRLYVTPYNDILKIYREECNITSHQWLGQTYHYLMVMDSVKCVAGRKQLALEREGKKEYASASDYYKVWSFNGNIGQQKIRIETNFQAPYGTDPLFAYRYSLEYVEGLIGKIHHAFKFFGTETKEMNRFIGNHMDENFLSEAHPDSIFMRYIWSKDYSLVRKDNQPSLKIRQ